MKADRPDPYRRSLGLERLEGRAMMDASSMEYTDVPDTMDTTAAEISHALVNSGDSGNFNQGVITPEGEGEASGPSTEDLQHLYDVQQKYGFQLNRSYYLNEFGHQDKALYGADTKWYQIRPDGSIWESAGTCILKEQVHPDAYADPERYLFNAEPPLAPEAVDAFLSESAASSEVIESAEPSSVSREDLSHLYDVQQKYGFSLNRSFYLNEFGHQDKALYGADGKWYQIRPDGSIWESAGTCIFKEQVHPDAYTDPERYLFNAEPPLDPAAASAIFGDSAALSEILGTEVIETAEPQLVSSNPEVQNILDSLSSDEQSQVIASLSQVQSIQQQHGYHKPVSFYKNEQGRGEIAVLDREGNWKIMYPNGEIGDAGGNWHIDTVTAPVYQRYPELLFHADEISLQMPEITVKDPTDGWTNVESSEGTLREAVADPIVDEARRLQETFDFYSSGNLYENDVEQGTFWFLSRKDEQWYVIDRHGAVYKFEGRGIASSTKVGQLDERYPTKEGINLLFNALDAATDTLARSLKQSEESEALKPSFSVSAYGKHALSVSYENVSEGTTMVLVKYGTDPSGGNYIERQLSKGSGTAMAYLPYDPEETRAQIFFLNDSWQVIESGPAFWFGEGTITESFMPQEANVVDRMQMLTEPAQRNAFSEQAFNLVKGILPPLQLRNPEAEGAGEGIAHGYEIMKIMTDEAVRLVVMEHQGHPRATAAEVDAAGRTIRQDSYLIAFGELINPPSGADILNVVRTNFDTLCEMLEGKNAEQNAGIAAAEAAADREAPKVELTQAERTAKLLRANPQLAQIWGTDVYVQKLAAAEGNLVAQNESTPQPQSETSEVLSDGIFRKYSVAMGLTDQNFDLGENLQFGQNSLEAMREFVKNNPRLWQEWAEKNNIEVPTSKNTLIIVIYGSNQIPGDGSGFDKLTEELRNQYGEVWGFSPGENPSVIVRGLYPAEAQELIKQTIISRVEHNSELKNIIIGGFSWGAGTTKEISEWLDEKSIKLNIIGTFYVDAVALGSAAPELEIPLNTQSMMNIFQSRVNFKEDSILLLNGGELKSMSGIVLEQIDLDIESNAASHTYDQNAIDQVSIDYILRYIGSLVVPHD